MWDRRGNIMCEVDGRLCWVDMLKFVSLFTSSYSSSSVCIFCGCCLWIHHPTVFLSSVNTSWIPFLIYETTVRMIVYKNAELQFLTITHVNSSTPPLPISVHCTRWSKRVKGKEGGIQREKVWDSGWEGERSPLDICSVRCCAQQQGHSKIGKNHSHPWKMCC